ncbi:MarR family transcriptional repressor of emrRAB [Streptomyces umbrinus]|uniref:MarR family transcriptional repressor of emrRAB n=1 Tax=Streptomyces umbrinus TaxID=67370 RepID=A0ABU0TA61_9ACTN|nr:helix-turn-helix domain-containing protein [Streptomyces umbrinus]MDQ1032702.1 MarR family transcriptional repressor of emrRAB [Streptomyces umbrinus]
MHNADRVSNLLGAAALAITDRTLARIADAAGVSASAAAAVVVLSTSPGLGVTELGRRIGLSQSATARMVDSLEAAGLARRDPSAGRLVQVTLTDHGRLTASKVLRARDDAVAEVLSGFDGEETTALESLLCKLLARLYHGVQSADLLCRLCDRSSCVEGAACPVGQAERDEAGG